MGFFDRLAYRKPAAPAAARPEPEPAAAPGSLAPAPDRTAGGVLPQLAAARERLEAKDLPGALAVYEQVIAAAGDRPDVLATISGDLGVNGFIEPIVDLLAPVYDAQKHGPGAGLNLLQAYIALNNAGAAQHLLDLLFALKRPELEERLHGFSTAISALIAVGAEPLVAGGEPPPDVPKLDLVSISKPIWFYGLEAAPGMLPEKTGRLRRVGFAQLALPGRPDLGETQVRPEDDLGRLTRALPLLLAEQFFFSANYTAITAVAVLGRRHYALFGAEWTADNVRQFADTAADGLDYAVTGAIARADDGFALTLRVWEVKKLKERKVFALRAAAAELGAAALALGEQLRAFMECAPLPDFSSAAPADPAGRLDATGLSLSLFLAGKGVLPREQLPDPAVALDRAAAAAAADETGALLWLTLDARCRQLGLPVVARPAGLFASPKVDAAARALGA